MSTGMLSTYTQHVICQNSRVTEGKIIFSAKKLKKYLEIKHKYRTFALAFRN